MQIDINNLIIVLSLIGILITLLCGKYSRQIKKLEKQLHNTQIIIAGRQTGIPQQSIVLQPTREFTQEEYERFRQEFEFHQRGGFATQGGYTGQFKIEENKKQVSTKNKSNEEQILL